MVSRDIRWTMKIWMFYVRIIHLMWNIVFYFSSRMQGKWIMMPKSKFKYSGYVFIRRNSSDPLHLTVTDWMHLSLTCRYSWNALSLVVDKWMCHHHAPTLPDTQTSFNASEGWDFWIETSLFVRIVIFIENFNLSYLSTGHFCVSAAIWSSW